MSTVRSWSTCTRAIRSTARAARASRRWPSHGADGSRGGHGAAGEDETCGRRVSLIVSGSGGRQCYYPDRDGEPVAGTRWERRNGAAPSCAATGTVFPPTWRKLLGILGCAGTESNCRHGDFQSPALPTELPAQSPCLERASLVGATRPRVRGARRSRRTAAGVKTPSVRRRFASPRVTGRTRSPSARRRRWATSVRVSPAALGGAAMMAADLGAMDSPIRNKAKSSSPE